MNGLLTKYSLGIDALKPAMDRAAAIFLDRHPDWSAKKLKGPRRVDRVCPIEALVRLLEEHRVKVPSSGLFEQVLLAWLVKGSSQSGGGCSFAIVPRELVELVAAELGLAPAYLTANSQI